MTSEFFFFASAGDGDCKNSGIPYENALLRQIQISKRKVTRRIVQLKYIFLYENQNSFEEKKNKADECNSIKYVSC
jgi:hypothetical protein